MKKVCHLTSVHDRYDNRILKRECVALKEHGYDVTLVVCDDMPSEVYKGVKIVSTGNTFKDSRLKRMIKGVDSVYRKGLAVGADVYHLHDPELLRVALKLKRKGKRVIFDSHEFYAIQISIKSYLPRIIREIIADLYYRLETYISNRIDAVIVPCRIQRDGIDSKYSFEGRCRLVGYVNNYPRIDEFEYQEKNYYECERVVCYSGSISYARGISHLIKASKISNSKFYFAGKFESQSYMDKILKFTNDQDIIYKGFLQSDELCKMYHKSYIGMCTHLSEGQFNRSDNLATKVYEYMSMGMPVIISNSPYNRTFIHKYPIGLIADPRDVNDIANKMSYIFSHPKEAEKMGKLGRKVYLERFNGNIAEKELMRVYKSI